MTTILTFIIPALIVVLLSLPLVNVFKGKVTAKSAKMRLGTHICGFFGAVALVLFLTYANSPVLAAGADKMTGSIAQGLGFIGAALATGLSALGAGIAIAAAAPAAIGAFSENAENAFFKNNPSSPTSKITLSPILNPAASSHFPLSTMVGTSW